MRQQLPRSGSPFACFCSQTLACPLAEKNTSHESTCESLELGGSGKLPGQTLGIVLAGHTAMNEANAVEAGLKSRVLLYKGCERKPLFLANAFCLPQIART